MDSTIYRFKNMRIAMFLGDHPPPHVHLLGPDIKVLIELESLKCKGRCDVQTLSEARAWMGNNHAMLMQIWQQRGVKR